MIFVRPSKTFQFELLEKELQDIPGEIGIDAGSNNFKNRRMFRTKKYFGLDMDLSAIKKGIEKNKDKNTFGILADITKMEVLPSNSCDVIVSTNTLYVLSPEQRRGAITGLSRLTKSTGKLIIELPMDETFNRLLGEAKNNFEETKIYYFKNPISRAYEKLFEVNGYLGSHPIAGSYPFLAISWMISRIEYLTCGIARINRHALIICTNKKTTEPFAPFDVSGLKLIGERIFMLLDKE